MMLSDTCTFLKCPALIYNNDIWTTHISNVTKILSLYNLVQQSFSNRLLDCLVVDCWQRVPGTLPSQGPRHTKDVIKMVPVVPLFGTQHWKREILALSQELRWDKKVMDTIWYKNPSKSEVIGPCGEDEKSERPSRTDKRRTLKKSPKKSNV